MILTKVFRQQKKSITDALPTWEPKARRSKYQSVTTATKRILKISYLKVIDIRDPNHESSRAPL